MSGFHEYNYFPSMKLKILLAIQALNEEKHIDGKGIPPAPDQRECPFYLCIFHHLKLKIVFAIQSFK